MHDNSQAISSSHLTFVREWVRSPARVAAVAPSGRSLARLITRDISPSSAPVIELGPGSGVFTRELLNNGVPEDRLALVERGSLFLEELARAYPSAQIHAFDASELRHKWLFDGQGAGAVVSGLPLLSMPPFKVLSILHGSFRNLRAGAGFYQFTYGRKCPVPSVILDRLRLRAERTGRTVLNIPPASVYRISRAVDGDFRE